MKKYKEFLITAEPFNSEVLSGILWELNITGINEEFDRLYVFADEVSDLNQGVINGELEKLQAEGLLRSFTVRESVLEEKNWNEEWEKSLNIIHVSDKIAIKPSTKSYEKKTDEIVITIDPKMSFGTGEHQTTKLVIQLLEKYIKPGMRILDAGTGTGILSVAAVKLGAVNAIGFDTDERCYENAMENSVVNGVSDKVKFVIGEISVVPEKDFDLILANIQKNILLELSDKFFEKLSKEGAVLLSGLLRDDEADILEKYRLSGFRHEETIEMDEWVAISFVKS